MSLLMDALKKAEQAKALNDPSLNGSSRSDAANSATEHKIRAGDAQPQQTSSPAAAHEAPHEAPKETPKELLQFSIAQIEPVETGHKKEALEIEAIPAPEAGEKQATTVPDKEEKNQATVVVPRAADAEHHPEAADAKTPPSHDVPAGSTATPKVKEKTPVWQQVPVMIGKPKMNKAYLWGGLVLLLCSGFGYYYMTLLYVAQSSISYQGNAVPADPDKALTEAGASADNSADKTAQQQQPAPAVATQAVVPEKVPEKMPAKERLAVARRGLAETGKNRMAAAGPEERATPQTQEKPATTTMRIEKGAVEDPLQLILQTAYAAYQEGDFDRATGQYRQALKNETDNRDALLGLAVIAQRQGEKENARTLYRRLLTLNPKDSVAASGLLSMNESGVATQNISQLKLMLQEEPTAAHLYFSLANEYALQARWPEAQQAYFQAHRYAPESADYAFNLAVSLEKMGQPQAALDYYRLALNASANAGGAASFDRQRLAQRIETLTAK